MDSEQHPWMGWDRYHIAKQMLEEATSGRYSGVNKGNGMKFKKKA